MTLQDGGSSGEDSQDDKNENDVQHFSDGGDMNFQLTENNWGTDSVGNTYNVDTRVEIMNHDFDERTSEKVQNGPVEKGEKAAGSILSEAKGNINSDSKPALSNKSITSQTEEMAEKPKPVSWAALFKSNVAKPQSDKGPTILSVQMSGSDQDNSSNGTGEDENKMTLISLKDDKRAKDLAGK